MVPHPLSPRPTYALPALQKYLSHISLPVSHQRILLQHLPKPKHDTRPTDWGTSTDSLAVLGTLQKYQQARIPFANLYLHYSAYHVGTPLDAEALWRYLIRGEAMVGTGVGFARSHFQGQSQRGGGGVEEEEQIINIAPTTPREIGTTELARKWANRPASGGRGGTCTLNNGFFGTVMRSLGMRVMSTGARVARNHNGANAAEDGKFMGWNHLVNLVVVEGRWFLVDVGFGGGGPTTPLELIDGLEAPWGNTTSLIRLIHAPIAEFTEASSKVWILQHKRSSDSGWRDMYCFTTTEFLPQDIQIMTYSTTGDVRGSFFNHVVVCQRTVMEGEDVVGTIAMVGGKVKRRAWVCVGEKGDAGGDAGGDGRREWKSEELAQCRSEIERWEALERWFGIVLGREERMGIRGLVSELKGDVEVEV